MLTRSVPGHPIGDNFLVPVASCSVQLELLDPDTKSVENIRSMYIKTYKSINNGHSW